MYIFYLEIYLDLKETTETRLRVSLRREAHDRVEDGWTEGDDVTLPKVGTENSVKGPGYHHEHGAWTENTGGEQQKLVDHEQVADVVIASYCALERRQQVDAIHHG